jgi:hypothetical protein
MRIQIKPCRPGAFFLPALGAFLWDSLEALVLLEEALSLKYVNGGSA